MALHMKYLHYKLKTEPCKLGVDMSCISTSEVVGDVRVNSKLYYVEYMYILFVCQGMRYSKLNCNGEVINWIKRGR